MAKRSRSKLVQAVCRNCGTPTVGRYCHICGQDLFAGRTHRLREIVGDSLATIFALDGKILRTLWYLIAFPGRLTKEFYIGRIVRYVFPSKLFWFITIIFFALLWSTANIENVTSAVNEAMAADSTATQILTEVPAAPLTPASAETDTGSTADLGITADFGSETGTWSVEIMEKKIDSKKLIDSFMTWSPYMVLLLMPIFALLVMLFFWRRERSYSDYLVFALHFHSFVFLLLSVGLVLEMVFPDISSGDWIVLWIPAIYLAVALRGVFRPRIIPMIFKIALLGLIYLIFMAAVLVLFSIIFAVLIN